MLARRPLAALHAGLVSALLTLLLAPLQAAPPANEIGFAEYILAKLGVALPTADIKVADPLVIASRSRYGWADSGVSRSRLGILRIAAIFRPVDTLKCLAAFLIRYARDDPHRGRPWVGVR
jgi:hypothetical protein